MKKFLAASVVLSVLASPAFAQSFDPENGTGNVLPFGTKSISSQNDSGIRAYGMAPRAHSAHVMPRHKDGEAFPEVNDPVGLVSPQADFSGAASSRY